MPGSGSSCSIVFFDLPVEIRTQIYTHIFQTNPSWPKNRIAIGNPNASSSVLLIPSLCQVNRLFFHEALPIHLQTATITLWRLELLRPLTHKLKVLVEGGLNDVKYLDFSNFSTRPLDAGLVLGFITNCPKLEHLSLNLDCTINSRPVSGVDVSEQFHLCEILTCSSLRTLYITVETSPHSPPLAPELQGLLDLVQMQRTRKIAGHRNVDRAVSGNRRLYTFREGNEAATRKVREWFEKQWKDMGMDVKVLNDEEVKHRDGIGVIDISHY